MAHPVWLLDVDGVLNANRPGWGGPPRQGTAYAHGHPYRLRWAPPLLDRIRAVHTGGLAELRWSSTWCSHADQVERLMRLPVLPRALTDEEVAAPGAFCSRAKLEAAFWVVEVERRPLVWTDDLVVPHAGPDRERLSRAGVPVLLVTPRGNRGLQPEHLDEIEEFLQANTDWKETA